MKYDIKVINSNRILDCNKKIYNIKTNGFLNIEQYLILIEYLNHNKILN